MLNIAIVGFGNAGYQAAKAVRECGTPARIHVYSDKHMPPSNPMLTTYYVKESIPYEAVFPYGSIEKIKREYDLEFHGDTPVAAVDGPGKALIFEDGSRKIFDKILIATGAVPFLPSSRWEGMERVLVMRTPEDACRLKALLDTGRIRSVLVAGASMVGIKIAELALLRGMDCTMIDGAPYLFSTAAFESTARRIEEFLNRKGIHMAFSAILSGIQEEEDKSLTAVMRDGRSFRADLILVCIGTRANTSCIKDDSIKVNKGILVDDRMMTSCEDIYGAGDCTEGYELQSGKKRVIGLWANAGYQGRTAGKNMAGNPDTFREGLLCNISHFMGMDFIGLGDASAPGDQEEVFEYEGGSLYLKAVKKDGLIRGVNLLDGAQVSGIVRDCFIRCLSGHTSDLDIEQYGVMTEAGIPPEFIRFIGGKS